MLIYAQQSANPSPPLTDKRGAVYRIKSLRVRFDSREFLDVSPLTSINMPSSNIGGDGCMRPSFFFTNSPRASEFTLATAVAEFGTSVESVRRNPNPALFAFQKGPLPQKGPRDV